MNPPTRPVVKVGGSLLNDTRLVQWLQNWLAHQNPAPAVLIAGGGHWADSVRAADKRFDLGEEAAHWLSVRAMSLTAQLLSALLPEIPLTTDLSQVRCSPGATFVLDAEDFLRRNESQVEGAPLSRNWSVTSDSIAARVAIAIDSDELILLKSSLPPRDTSMQQAAEAGYVDRFLPTATESLSRVRCVNLRDERFAERMWRAANQIGDGGYASKRGPRGSQSFEPRL